MKKDIYIIKNDINDKVYVGQAKNTKTRFQGHCKPSAAHHGDLVARAIQKYGREHFYYEILESQIEDYNEKERYYIKQYNCMVPNGYNITIGGEDSPIYRGYEHPEAILSQSQIEELTKDLKETSLSFVELAAKYGFKSNTSISEFNKGNIQEAKKIQLNAINNYRNIFPKNEEQDKEIINISIT